jgi:hypothetical protein
MCLGLLQGLSNTREYKHKYISLRSTMPSPKVFENIKVIKYMKL